MTLPSSGLPPEYADDVRAVQDIDVVPTILDVVCQITGLGFAAVARVTEDRWIACAVRDTIGFGLKPGGELEIRTTICNEIRGSGHLVAIDDVYADAVFRDHHTPRMYGFRSYISVPIWHADGSMFGTLCAIDPKPATVKTDTVINTLTLFADLVGKHLQSQERMRDTAAALVSAEVRAELQDQFVAIMSHDLRTPLSAIDTATTLLMGMGIGPEAEHLVRVIARSGRRMSGLVSNVLDFAHARLGDGVPVDKVDDANLIAAFQTVIEETRTVHPGRTIDVALDISRGGTCDPARFSQLLANLLTNALTHGAADGPVTVEAHDRDGFTLSVANAGAPIPPATLARLFQPFVRGASRRGPDGLGLGLYIASEIARAHDGTLTATSDDDRTVFTFRVPLTQA